MTSTHSIDRQAALRKALPYATILTAALLATLPLMIAGPSCGHDLTFHLLNWMDAAHQWSNGTLRPWWCFPAAWNTGEPRFLFYPPLSWMLGALLTLIVGAAHSPVAYTFLALTASGMTMRRFLAEYVSPPLALLGACLYLAHPYMLFTATERTAYAELLAAAWLPWLLQELLRNTANRIKKTSVPHVRILRRGMPNGIRPTRLAIPIALLWLTNTPAAILGTYTVAVLLVLRIAVHLKQSKPYVNSLLIPAIAGYLLGLALSAWYLLPALVQHSAIQVDQAFTGGMQPEDGTLFRHTGDPLHDAVIHQASTLAIFLLVIAAIAVGVCFLQRRRIRKLHGMREAELQKPGNLQLLAGLLTLTAVTLFLLTPASLWLWHRAPELHFLQFPFRTLMLQGVVTVTLIVLAVRFRLPMRWSVPLALVAVATISFPAHHAYAQFCDDEDKPTSLAAQYERGEGFEPYDEYTPDGADDSLVHPGEPFAWTGNKPTDAPSAATVSRILEVDFGNQRSFQVRPTAADRYLIVRQRRFPGWRVTVDGNSIETQPMRDDGLLAVRLPDTAPHTIDLQYHWSFDQIAGALLSVATGAGLLLASPRRARASS